MSSTIDDAFYGGIGLLINTTQNRYRTQNQTISSKPYNFYKDQNIPEVYNTGELLDRIEARVLNELKQWPDHAVLNDVSFLFLELIHFFYLISTNSCSAIINYFHFCVPLKFNL